MILFQSYAPIPFVAQTAKIDVGTFTYDLDANYMDMKHGSGR